MGTYPPNTILYVPTHDEKTFALLAHVLGIFSDFIAPLVLFLVKRDSKFVTFHALQSLAWHIIYFAIFSIGTIIGFVAIFASVGFSGTQHPNHPPLGFFVIFGFVWLFIMGGALMNMILGIVYGIKAHNGEWAKYPLIGGWILSKVSKG